VKTIVKTQPRANLIHLNGSHCGLLQSAEYLLIKIKRRRSVEVPRAKQAVKINEHAICFGAREKPEKPGKSQLFRFHLFGTENLEIVALPIAQIRRAFYVYAGAFRVLSKLYPL